MTKRKPHAAIIGGGVIGGAWAARFLLHGWDISLFDPHPDAQAHADHVLGNARASTPALVDQPLPREGNLEMVGSIAAAVSVADWIQESVPEVLETKHEVIAEIEAHASDDAIVASSTSGFTPSQLQQGCRVPRRLLVAHPFNPVYLLPVVEIVGGTDTGETEIDRACSLLESVGMKPMRVRKEIDAHVADRLLESIWREALWLVKDDVATTGEIDDIMRYGFGLRWAQMGLFETYRLAGGEEGMAHFMRQFGPALQWPWSKLTNVPELDEELVQKIARQSDAQSGHLTHRELERLRDRNIVGILRALKERNTGAGVILNEFDRKLAARQPLSEALQVSDGEPLRVLDLTVLPGWIDYNGHMTEFRYVQVFSDSCDRLLPLIGMDADYVANGCSYYTVETHTMQVDEVGANAPIYTTAQFLSVDEKRLHIFYCLRASDDDRLLATTEAMYLHVNRKAGRVCPAADNLVAAARRIAAAHETLPRPEVVGRFVGQR